MLVVGVAMLAAAFLLAYWSRGEWFGSDDLGYAVRLATQPLGHALIHPPPNKYLIAAPLLFYDAALHLFGLGTYVPYRATSIVLVLGCAGLLFALLRRRLPDHFAVPPTLLMLFFGAGAEVVVTPTRIPSQFALAAGLGMLLALERSDRRGDLAAMALLGVSLASHPLGIAFAAAAAVMILLRSGNGWRALWVVAIPGALFAVWWFFIRPPELPSFVPNRPIDVLPFVRQSWAALTAAVTGLFGIVERPAVHQPPAWIAAGALLALIAAGVAFSWRRLPSTFWAAIVGLLVLMATARLAPAGFLRVPDEPRYLYPEAFFLLIALGTLAGTLRLPNWAMLVASAVLLLSLWPNIDRLHDASRDFRRGAKLYRTGWSAAELGEPSTRAGFMPDRISPNASEYLATVRAFGAGGYSAGTIAGLPDDFRRVADADLVAALGLGLAPAPRPEGAAPCRPASGELTLPRGGVWLGPDVAPDAELLLGRFADRPTVPLERPQRARGVQLRLPPDSVEAPWKLLLRSRAPISVCGL
jgi:hypothetical protein